MWSIDKTWKTTLFVDNTNFFFCGDHLEQLLDSVEKDLEQNQDLVDQNKLNKH